MTAEIRNNMEYSVQHTGYVINIIRCGMLAGVVLLSFCACMSCHIVVLHELYVSECVDILLYYYTAVFPRTNPWAVTCTGRSIAASTMLGPGLSYGEKYQKK